MLRHERSAPIWLFSFVDLAFLLLIAFTQISSDLGAGPVDLGQIQIPRIRGDASTLVSTNDAAQWQLRVHPSATGGSDTTPPFELSQSGSMGSGTSERIDAEDLDARLRVLALRHEAKPIVAPHRDSRSEDLLVAVDLLETVWQLDRAVTVVPGASVAAPPPSQTTQPDGR